MDQVNNIVCNAIINTDGTIIVSFTQEQWRFIIIACKNYTAKLDCARRQYHKYKELKGKRNIDEEMAIVNEISNLEAKPLTEVCLIKNQVDTNPKPKIDQVDTNLKPEVCLIKNQVDTNCPS